jgi:hypothetical protein
MSVSDVWKQEGWARGNGMDLEVGKNYFVRTVTDYWLGELVSVDGPYTLTLRKASWVADSGRLHVFMREGQAPNMEIEPVGVVSCQWVAVLPWPHRLLTEAV